MKLTKLIALSFVTCSGVLALSPIVQAADGATVKTEGSIGFEIGTDPVDPVDPLNPENPLVPIDPGTPGTDGPLSIDYVSKIKFGDKNTTSGKDAVYWAKLAEFENPDDADNSLKRPNFIQVTDNRGSNAGWNLKVTQEEQFMNGTEELTGAELVMANGVMATADSGLEPTITSPITLTPGQATTVVNADANGGTGTWVALFGKDNDEGAESISLSVPGKTKKIEGVYTTALTWDLTDAPA